MLSLQVIGRTLYWTENDVKGSEHTLILGIVLEFAWGDYGKTTIAVRISIHQK